MAGVHWLLSLDLCSGPLQAENVLPSTERKVSHRKFSGNKNPGTIEHLI